MEAPHSPALETCFYQSLDRRGREPEREGMGPDNCGRGSVSTKDQTC